MANINKDHLTQLRRLAQHHLTEIEAEVAQEEAQTLQGAADLQKYVRMPSSKRPKPGQNEAQISQVLESENVKPKFRPFQDILHRLRWDSQYHIEDYVVGYVERFEGLKEMPASNWIRDFSDEEWIPMHRVRYVKRVSGTNRPDDQGPELGMAWDRDERVDKFTKNEKETEMDRSDVFSMDGTSVTGGVEL